MRSIGMIGCFFQQVLLGTSLDPRLVATSARGGAYRFDLGWRANLLHRARGQ
jgi:hypothetical protein